MKWFPNGFGSRTSLAFMVVGGAVAASFIAHAYDKLFEMALMVIAFYFIDKAHRGYHQEASNDDPTTPPIADEE